LTALIKPYKCTTIVDNINAQHPQLINAQTKDKYTQKRRNTQTFFLSLINVHGLVFSMPKSSFSVLRNHFHVTVSSTSTIAIEMG
jgi:hypothetical protein